MKKSIILEPIETSPCVYEWKELEVRTSKQPNAGNGVFAKVELKAGTLIPLLGVKISGIERDRLEEVNKATHVWDYYQNDLITII